jgi:ribonuclease T2
MRRSAKRLFVTCVRGKRRHSAGFFRSRLAGHPFAPYSPSKLPMTKRVLSGWLLSVVLVTNGCRTVPQQQPSSSDQRSSGQQRSGNGDQYNRSYQAETHHRHRHGRRDEASSDSWASYDRVEDRAETANATSGGAEAGGFLPRQRDAQGGNGSPATRSNRHRNSRALTSAPGQFDFYVLNLSWSPEFCQQHPTAIECAQHLAFTLHGLWPQNTDGTYPEDCSDAPGPANPSQYADIYPDPSLLQHEWQTHGTCSGLAPDQFFALARRARQSIQIPVGLSHLTQQASLTPSQIIVEFTQSNPAVPAAGVAVTCGNNKLTAVEVCLNKNLQPESCSAVKSCGANTVRIPAPQ